MAITRAQQVRQMYKEGSKEPVEQAGVMNYMPSEMVTVPKIAKSSPDTPTAKLAYITPEEQDILIDLNLYGSLDGKPNRGPGGIPSLEGDFGTPGGFVGGGGGRQDNDVSGRRDTGTGNYRDSTRPDDVAARKEYEVNRKKREAEEKKNRDKEAEKKARKEVRDFLRTTKKAETDRRRKKINRILTGDFPPVRIGDKLYRNQFGLPANELADLVASGIDTDKLTKNDVDALNSLFEKNDRFSGVNLEAFQNEFNLPKTGLTSLDIALGFAEPFLAKGSKKTKEFFSGTEDGLGKNIFGKPRKSVLEAGKYKFDGNVVTPDMFALMDPALMDDVYKDYMGKRMSGETDAYGNPNPNFGMKDDDPEVLDPCKGPNPPAYCNVGGGDDDTTPPSTGVFAGIAPRFAGSIFDFDKLRANAMDGGMIEDTPVGGIMDLESGRQMYFLGKLVKKAKRAVKKVAKSPFGKIALGYALTGGLGNLAGGSGLGGMFKGFMSPSKFLAKESLSNIFTKGGAKNILFGGQKLMGNPAKNNFVDFSGILGSGGKFSLGKGLTLGFGIPMALDALGVGKDDEGFDMDEYYKTQGIDIDAIRNNPYRFLGRRFVGMADGGRINYQEGGDAEPVAKKTMPLIDMDGKEKDYRETGGFVDMGRMERADDVPARLSKNEFVFTADAVRNAGEGDIDKGAEVMYNMMKNLEAGGEVSEESQGLEGAREMFKTSQRLGEVI